MCVGGNRRKKTQHSWPQFGKDWCHLKQQQQLHVSDGFVTSLDLRVIFKNRGKRLGNFGIMAY